MTTLEDARPSSPEHEPGSESVAQELAHQVLDQNIAFAVGDHELVINGMKVPLENPDWVAYIIKSTLDDPEHTHVHLVADGLLSKGFEARRLIDMCAIAPLESELAMAMADETVPAMPGVIEAYERADRETSSLSDETLRSLHPTQVAFRLTP
jgi:hypothetical protein